MILLDTHALLWWALDPEQLSSQAAHTIDEMEQKGGYASSISAWELGIKQKRGKLEMGISIEELTRRIQQGGVVELLPVDTNIWLRSLSLQWSHRDPADRVIVASALSKGVRLLTKDRLIQDSGLVETVW